MAVAGIPAYKRKVCAGYVQHPSDSSKQAGHAYAIYLREDNEWIPLDWCYWANKTSSLDKFTIHNEDKHYKDIWFTFNEEYSWSQKNFIISKESD